VPSEQVKSSFNPTSIPTLVLLFLLVTLGSVYPVTVSQYLSRLSFFIEIPVIFSIS